MSEFSEASYVVPIPQAYLADAAERWDQFVQWHTLTKRERAQKGADLSSVNYEPTCGDLMDLDAPLWLEPDEYLAAGTYVCERARGHKGKHRGSTVEGYRDQVDERVDWDGRKYEAKWERR